MKKAFLGFAMGVVLITLMALFLVTQQKEQRGDTTPRTAPTPTASNEVVPKPPAAPRTTQEPPKPKTAEDYKQEEAIRQSELQLVQYVENSGTYTPGDLIEVTFAMKRAEDLEQVQALGLEAKLPEGFLFEVMGKGPWPDLYPKQGQSGPHQFAWIQVPTFPVTFSYFVKTPENPIPAGNYISSEALYRTSGGELRSNPVASTLRIEGQEDAVARKIAAPKETYIKRHSPPIANRDTDAASAQAKLMQVRQVPGNYTPGKGITIKVQWSAEELEALEQFAYTEILPEGWAFKGLTPGQNDPIITPSIDKTGLLTFIWSSPTPLPITLEFTLLPPADATGNQRLEGQAIYHWRDKETRSAKLITDLNPNE